MYTMTNEIKIKNGSENKIWKCSKITYFIRMKIIFCQMIKDKSSCQYCIYNVS